MSLARNVLINLIFEGVGRCVRGVVSVSGGGVSPLASHRDAQLAAGSRFSRLTSSFSRSFTVV